MPTTQNTINLIRTKTSESPQLDAIEVSLRRTGYIAIIGFLCLSVITGSVYAFFSHELSKYKTEQSELITRINSLKTKEGYLLAIKDRTKTVEKAMSNQKPWGQMLDLVATFTAPPALVNIAVDEQNKIVLTLKTGSLEQILSIVDTISNHVNAGKIRSPQLISFQFGKSGDFEISLSFYAMFDTAI